MSVDRTLQSIADVLADHEAAYHPGQLCPEDQHGHCAARPRPVPSPEDRMADARTDTDHLDVAAELVDAGPPHDVATWLAARDARTAPTFRTYLDDTDRAQLDARAACAEAERDEATEDRDLLRAENANLTAGLRTERVKTGRLEGDLRSLAQAVREALAERDVFRQTAALRQGVIDRHRQELGAAGDVLAVVRDAAERIDRALATYDTTPVEAPEREDGRPERVAEDIAAAIETHFLPDDLTAIQAARIARHHATQYGQAPSSVPSRRAQEEPTAAHLAEHLSTHQWYSKPEFPLLHEPSAHREHIYNSDCAICRGDLSRIAAVALAYVQTRP